MMIHSKWIQIYGDVNVNRFDAHFGICQHVTLTHARQPAREFKLTHAPSQGHRINIVRASR
jgi:hypothetical protein